MMTFGNNKSKSGNSKPEIKNNKPKRVEEIKKKKRFADLYRCSNRFFFDGNNFDIIIEKFNDLLEVVLIE